MRAGGRVLVEAGLRVWGGTPVPAPAPSLLSSTRRLAPMYASACALWLLLALAALGLLAHFLPAALRTELQELLPRA